jgi:hypothetical protein
MTAALRSITCPVIAAGCEKDVITLLEAMLVSARSGKTRGILVIEVTCDGEDPKETANTFYQAGIRDRYKALGYLTRIIHELNAQP